MLTKGGAPALTLQGGRVHKGSLITRAPEITSKEAADALRRALALDPAPAERLFLARRLDELGA